MITLQKDQVEMLITTLDTLGLAMTETGVTWTPRQRTLYEDSTNLLKNLLGEAYTEDEIADTDHAPNS